MTKFSRATYQPHAVVGGDSPDSALKLHSSLKAVSRLVNSLFVPMSPFNVNISHCTPAWAVGKEVTKIPYRHRSFPRAR